MSWSWDACDGSKCLSAVYADSLTAVSDGKYKFKDHPDVLKSFDASFARIEAAPCELLLTPHPEASGGLAKLEQAGGKLESLKSPDSCKNFVKQARDDLAKRLAGEGG